MNYSVTVAGENATRERFPHADRVAEFDAAQLTFTPQTYVVVASHGNYDEPALEAALRSEAAYVALVASRKRRDAVLDYLRGSGLTEAQLARLRCPAGLDFGAVTPEEIALSVLAEIVQLRRRGTLLIAGSHVHPAGVQPSNLQPSTPPLPDSILAMRAAAHKVTPGPGEAVDPVCHMLVEIATAKWKSEFRGEWYYFCAPGCKRTFEKNPEQFAITSNE
jgi:xanthine dehydrogenase accessory factor